MVKNDMNLGSLIPIGIFLVAQTVVAIWWASDVSTKIDTLIQEVDDQAAEDLRQWARINGAEAQNVATNTNVAALRASVDSMRQEISILREDVRTNATILRQLLREVSAMNGQESP